MISSRKTRLARPENVFTMALITSTLLVIVLAPIPKQMPATRNTIVMMKMRLSISGESSKIDARLRVPQRRVREHGEQHHHGDARRAVPKVA